MTALQGWVATSFLLTFVNANFYGDRFPVYWNLFSDKCTMINKSLIPLDDYGITHNEDYKFHGDQIVLLYEYKFDNYPFLKKTNNTKGYQITNGGIPQRCNMSLFFTSAEKYILKSIPDPNFHGLGILDFEEWRPLLYLNWGEKEKYIIESKNYVLERFPDYSEQNVEAMAAKEFDKAASNLFVDLLLLAKKLRPFAKWGYYLYPYCNLGAIRKEGLNDCTHWIKHNDALNFIYEHQTALYPSIYYGKHDTPYNYRMAQIQLREARRISLSLKNPVPIYVYTKFEYNPYAGNLTTFYVKDDLCNSIQSTVDEGAAGLILWSTSQKMTERCTMIGEFVQKTLGTVVQNAIRKANKCSLKKCSGRGVCVVRGNLYDKCKWSMKGKDYYCQCDQGFAGEHCEKKRYRGSRRKNKFLGSGYVKTLNLPFKVDLSAEVSSPVVPLPTDEEPFV